MRLASRRAAAVLLAAAFLLPPLAAAAPPGAPSFAPVGGLRSPDPAQLADDAPDRPVAAPAAVRAALAAPVNWTVLVYMVADNGLESFAIQDLNEMEAVAASAGVHIVVEVDRSAANDASNGNWNETRRYLISHDGDTTAIASPMLASLGELDMGDPQTLADFLAWGVDTYPAQHTLVVLWDHGFGWANGFGEDESDNDHLSLAELHAALAAGAAHLGRPFDILAFDACLMQSVEVAYELAWLGDYLVAAQDREPAAGWPYDAMLAPLAADPSLSPEDLAGALVDGYLSAYGLQGETMMAATRSSSVRTALADALSALASEIAAVVDDPQTAPAGSPEEALWAARAGSPGMYTGEAFDLGEFTRLLSEDARLPSSLRAAASLAREALNTSIVAEGHSVYYAAWSGVAIHLPSVTVSGRYLSTDFARDSYWDEALAAMLSGVRAGGARPSLQVLSPAPGASIARRFGASLSATAGAGEPLRIQAKAGWAPYVDLVSDDAPVAYAGVLDAGVDAGPVVLEFRAVSGVGIPSPTIERRVTVEAPPVTFATPLSELSLAVNRTRTAPLTLIPRAPFQSFDIGWLGLPSDISGAGTTGLVNLPGGAPQPFNITLDLACGPTAAEGTFNATLFVRASSAPSLVAYLDLRLVVTRPLPDLAVAALRLSDDLPLPAEVVEATTQIANLGFEDVADARVTAIFTDAQGNATELANFTTGLLAPGAALPLSVNFTAERGTQRLTVRADIEPAGPEELTLGNNLVLSTITVVNFSVAVVGPLSDARVALGPSPTPVAFQISNRGTEADTYDLAVVNLTNVTWQVGLPTTAIPLSGRTSSPLSVDVLLPLAAQGGDGASFELWATSRADGAVAAFALASVVVEETYNATVRASQGDVSLAPRGSANVTVTVQNTGNGRESYSVVVEGGDPKLGTQLDASSLTLAPGQGGSSHLTLTDNGLLSADRPYSVEAVAISVSTGVRFAAIINVHVGAAPALTVVSLEQNVDAAANGSALFHARVSNVGNTNAIATVAASGTVPGLRLDLPVDAFLLEPGGSATLNGSISFASPPDAGNYAIALTAADTLSGVNASGQFELAIVQTHDLRATLAVAAAEGPRTLVRTLVIENHGNTPENVTLVLGYVPVGTRLEVDPAGDTFVVGPGQSLTLTLRIFGPADVSASGQIEVVLKSQGGTVTLPVQVSYDFAPPPPAPILEWALVAGAAGVAIVGWVFATRKRAPPVPPMP